MKSFAKKKSKEGSLKKNVSEEKKLKPKSVDERQRKNVSKK